MNSNGKYKTGVNVPAPVSLENALRIYYEKRELRIGDIMELFGCSKSRACALRKRALEEQAETGEPLWDTRAVNTKCAFRSWGIEVRDLEDSLGKLRRLRLCDTH